MTADEIRAMQLQIETRETEDGTLHYAVDINLRKFELLREIAAQFAEHNANSREALELSQKAQRRMFGDDKPTLTAGTVVKILTRREMGEEAYGQVCPLCGLIHPIPEEEALRIAAESMPETGRPQ